MTKLRPTILTGFMALIFALPAYAQHHSADVADVRKLVSDDVAILPAPYAARLKFEEISWEKKTGRYCSIDPENKYPASCLTADEVIADMKARIFAVDGLIIDGSDWRASKPAALDQDGEPSSRPVSLHQSIPQIVAPQTMQAKNFNRQVMAFAQRFWKSYGGPPKFDSWKDQDQDFDLTYSRAPNALPNVISIVFNLGIDTHGAGRGNDYNNVFNWLVGQDRMVEPGDIFDLKKDWQSALTEAVEADEPGANVPAGEGPRLNETVDPGTKAIATDPTRWFLERGGLTIVFNTDEAPPGPVASMAVVHWSLLRPYLKKDGLVEP